jgi:hypothetical protein
MNKYVLSCGLALLVLTSSMALKGAVNFAPASAPGSSYLPVPTPGGGYLPVPTPGGGVTAN